MPKNTIPTRINRAWTPRPSGEGNAENITYDISEDQPLDHWLIVSPEAGIAQLSDGDHETPGTGMLIRNLNGNGRLEFWDTAAEVIRLGDLNGNWGYEVPGTYGIAIGEYATSTANLTYDSTNGLRLRINDTTFVQLTNTGKALVTDQLEVSTGRLLFTGKITSWTTWESMIIFADKYPIVYEDAPALMLYRDTNNDGILAMYSVSIDTLSTATQIRISKSNGLYLESFTPTGGEFFHVDTGGNVTSLSNVRTYDSIYRRYYHLSLGSANPGASGATWVAASANTTGGWRLTNAAHILRAQADVHADWDGASDLTVSVHFMVNVNNTGGGAGDTVDLKLVSYYKGLGDTACKTQTTEVATVVGQSAQYKQFDATFTINWDQAGNVVEVGDVYAINLNLETDTSEVDDIVITAMEFYYQTTHTGVESGDV